jgi:hypothetical protein
LRQTRGSFTAKKRLFPSKTFKVAFAPRDRGARVEIEELARADGHFGKNAEGSLRNP